MLDAAFTFFVMKFISKHNLLVYNFNLYAFLFALKHKIWRNRFCIYLFRI